MNSHGYEMCLAFVRAKVPRLRLTDLRVVTTQRLAEMFVELRKDARGSTDCQYGEDAKRLIAVARRVADYPGFATDADFAELRAALEPFRRVE